MITFKNFRTLSLFIILLACAHLPVAAQVNIDSLWNIWGNQTNSDTIRLQALYNICDDRARSLPDSVIVWSNTMYEYAHNAGSQKYEAGALFQKGRAYSYKRGESDLDSTERLYSISLNLYEKINYKYGMARVLAYTAGLKFYQTDYTGAIYTAEKVIEIAEEINNKKLSAGVAMVLGNAYEVLGNSAKAIEIYENGLKDAQNIGDKQSEGFHLHAIADIYLQLDEFDLAKAYHRQSLQAYQEIDDMLGITDIIIHNSKISMDSGNFETSIEGFEKAFKMLSAAGIKNGQIEISLLLAQSYISIGDFQSAEQHIETAEYISKESNLKDYTGRVFLTKGSFSRSTGNNDKEAAWCNQALIIFEEIGHVGLQRDACNCLYQAYKSLNRSNEALIYHERFLALSDSLNLEEAAKKLQQVEFDQIMLTDSLKEVEDQLRVQIAHQEEINNERYQRNAFFFGGIAVLVLAGGLWSRLNYIRKSRQLIKLEKDRSDNLLLNILPVEVAEELKQTGKAKARKFKNVSILFTDFIDFTEISENLSATELVEEINYCFERFDNILEEFGVEKIKTIGDAYMAAGGLPVTSADSTKNTVLAALKMVEFTIKRKSELELKGKKGFDMRCGIHTGPIVAGIVGVKKFQYDVWGDTVNTASRMESFGQAGKVNISEDTYNIIKEVPMFTFTKREGIEVKGKGQINMYLVELAA